MSYTFKTMVVLSSRRDQAAQLCEDLDGGESAGMFTSGLSATGNPPASHFITSGSFTSNMVDLLSSPDKLYLGCQGIGSPLTLDDCIAILADFDISDEQPFNTIDRLSLMQISIPEISYESL